MKIITVAILLFLSANHPAFCGEIIDKNWYRPDVDVTWHWQLQGDIEQLHDVDIYNIDLFDTSAKKISQLQEHGYKIICYFSAGSWEEWRADAKNYPKEAIGNALNNWKGEYWLDIRNTAVRILIQERLRLAQKKGCDGVEPDNIDVYLYENNGFDITKQDQLQFAYYLAHEAHHLGLAVALKNLSALTEQLASHFDLVITERCHEHGTCGAYEHFIKAGKPVLNAEYSQRYFNIRNFQKLCQYSLKLGINSLLLPLKLDDGFRYSCLN
ncbi:MAG: endo alpha-1,4 polygalactosaminidase [Thiolinea sp.]